MGSSNHGASEMCMEAAATAGGRAGRRAGGKKAAAAAEQKGAARQPQRGLGVAQLEKIRMQNQIMAAYRSGMPPPPSAPQQQQQQAAMAGGAASSFQPYLAECFEAMDRRIADVQYSQYYAENLLLPYTSSRQQPQHPPPPMPFVQGAVKAGYSPSSPPSQYYWMGSTLHDSGATGRSSAGSSTEELDLELRL